MKKQTLYLMVNVTRGYVFHVLEDYREAVEWCVTLNQNNEDIVYRVIRIHDEEIIKVGELNVN